TARGEEAPPLSSAIAHPLLPPRRPPESSHGDREVAPTPPSPRPADRRREADARPSGAVPPDPAGVRRRPARPQPPVPQEERLPDAGGPAQLPVALPRGGHGHQPDAGDAQPGAGDHPRARPAREARPPRRLSEEWN